MKKPTFYLLSAFLFGSTLFGAWSPMPFASAQIRSLPQIQWFANRETAKGVTLMREDLPAGFTELPPAIREQLTAQFRTLSQQLGGAELDPDNLAVFVNPVTFQLAMGFTGKLENPQIQAEFDANLKKIQEPAVQQLVLTMLREKIAEFPNANLEVSDLSVLPAQDNLADASSGVTLDMKLQGQPFRVDLVSFRRDGVGAMVGVIYRPSAEALPVRPLADKLDRRILEGS